MQAAIPFLGHTEILPTLTGTGSADPAILTKVRRPEIPGRDQKVLKGAASSFASLFSPLNRFTCCFYDRWVPNQVSKRFLVLILTSLNVLIRLKETTNRSLILTSTPNKSYCGAELLIEKVLRFRK